MEPVIDAPLDIVTGRLSHALTQLFLNDIAYSFRKK